MAPMRTGPRLPTLAALALCTAVAGCASTTVERSGQAPKEPLCRPGADVLSVQVYWGPQWRPDQKEPALRESAALRGIQDFLARADCLRAAGIDRLADGAPGGLPTDAQLLQRAASSAPPPQRVLLVVVRELGPRLLIGAPTLVEGGTEVVLDVRVLDVPLARSLADARIHWRHGGSFVIKGVRSLDQDMSAALRALLLPAAAPG